MSHSEDYDVFPTNEWKTQLDFDRPCGAVNSDETCWLCGELTPWNRLMHALAFELVETSPGTLLLRAMCNVEADRDPATVAREASLLTSWLLCRHLCIRELDVICLVRDNAPADQPSFPIHVRPPSSSSSLSRRRFRTLNITESAGARLYLRGVDAVVGLETLFIDASETNRHFAAEIDALLERNRHTLKKVYICEHSPQRRDGLRMVESLVACEFLTLKSPHNKSRMPDMDAMVRLMRTSTSLKEVTAQPILHGEVSVIAKALETNFTLTKLSLYVETRGSIEELFRALQANRTLKELLLYCCLFINTRCMRAVASALRKNASLRALYMGVVFLDNCEGLEQWSEALSENCTLQFLRIYCGNISMRDISALCKALEVNKSLKKFLLPGAMGSEEERTSLARQLLADECYDRVQLGPWTEPYLRILSPVLASSPKSPEQLWLPDIGQLSIDSVRVLFNALASSKRVNSLTVDVKHEPDARVALLCETLKKNRSIGFLRVDIEDGDSANDVLRALTVNAAITELDITLRVVAAEETMAAFCGMLARNDAITNISAWLHVDCPRRFMEAIARGMSANRIVVNFRCWAGDNACVPSPILESVRRNKSALNRAVEFVLRRREDRHSAECFELFSDRPCLLAHLTETSGLSDVEARLEVASAEHRLREKYLLLTGVVRHSVVCWPADFTQIDALNAYCWRAIARYLRVADVCVQ
ncbi:uncharacterized protein [Dermacentor andersoni]|uniref:uncharacterized protein n=1 Tax=Dermacentor andersoni TaxID=34620 RepID=UPI003B3B58A2